MSGRRGSNPRPQPWQGCALPTELLPLLITSALTKAISYLNVCKDLIFPLPKTAYLFSIRCFRNWDCKNRRLNLSNKIFLLKNHLFILRSILGVSRYLYLGFTLVTMSIEAVTATYYKGNNTKYLQVK